MKTKICISALLLMILICLSIAVHATGIISAVRTLPEDVIAGTEFTVNIYLDINESDPPTAAGITENHPLYWDVIDASHGGMQKDPNGIDWLFIFAGDPVEDKNITYRLYVPLNISSKPIFFGNVIDNGTELFITGDQSVNVTFDPSISTTTTSLSLPYTTTTLPEKNLSVVRELPPVVVAGTNFTVKLYLDVEESNVPIAVGLIEQYPLDWVVSNTSGGIPKFNLDRIEWLFWVLGEPVIDRTVTYVIYVPADAEGNYTFSGSYLFSRNGSVVEIPTRGDDTVYVQPAPEAIFLVFAILAITPGVAYLSAKRRKQINGGI